MYIYIYICYIVAIFRYGLIAYLFSFISLCNLALLPDIEGSEASLYRKCCTSVPDDTAVFRWFCKHIALAIAIVIARAI